MPPTNPRIIVVDDNQGIYNVVRASLELLGRRPRLVETHTGSDALIELRISSADLLVTSQTLPEEIDGPQLAIQAKRELAALPVIVLGNERDPEIDEVTLAQSPFQYLRRPFAPETFLRTLRIALDGPEAVPQERSDADMMGPVPPLDLEKLRPILFRLMREVGAMATVLADRNGKVITYEGAAGYVDRDLLAAALGPGFGSTAKILSIVGDQPRVLKYYDGSKLDLFSLALGLHHFITLLFDPNTGDRAIGTVKRAGYQAINEMLAIMGDAAFSVKVVSSTASSASVPAARPASEATTRRIRRTQEHAAVVEPRPEARPEERREVRAEPRQEPRPEPRPAAPEAPSKAVAKAPKSEPVAIIDPSLLDALENLDMSAADAMFDPDRVAESMDRRASGNRISFEDAFAQGIIGNVDE